MAANDLIEFLKRETDDLTREYSRIQSRVTEDPGTAGDQTEENWATIFRLWLPSYYQVVTKGRIMAKDGTASPQVDVLVLSPAYPRTLLDKKHYLAGGVVAAFECKTTLRAAHLRKFFGTCIQLRHLSPNQTGTPARELRPEIIFGLLAHSHEWQGSSATPEQNVERAIIDLDAELVKRPVELPDVICIADLGVWQGMRSLLPMASKPGRFSTADADRLQLISGYIGHLHKTENQAATFTPIGALLSVLFQRFAWKDPLMRDLESYLRLANILGTGVGAMRHWPADVLSKELVTALASRRLTNGVMFDEWSMGPH